MAISHLPLRQHPRLFDEVIQDLQQGLKSQLSWLDYSFGRSERLVKAINGQRYFTPNVYVGNENYEVVLPDTVKLGNYSFFVMDEPQDVSRPIQTEVHLKSPFSLIVWVDMRKVGLNYDERNTEAIKEEILLAVQQSWIKRGRVEITKIYERAENVFAGFTLDETQNQFMMAPYYGWRFYGEMIINNDCIL